MKSILAKAVIITSTLLAAHNQASADALIDDLKDAKSRLYGYDLGPVNPDVYYEVMQKNLSTRLPGKWIQISDIEVDKDNIDKKCEANYFEFARIDEYSFSKKYHTAETADIYILKAGTTYSVRRDYQQAIKDIEKLRQDFPDFDKNATQRSLRFLNLERIVLMTSANSVIEASLEGTVSLYGRCP